MFILPFFGLTYDIDPYINTDHWQDYSNHQEPPQLFNLTDKIPELEDKLDKGVGNRTIVINQSLNIGT